MIITKQMKTRVRSLRRDYSQIFAKRSSWLGKKNTDAMPPFPFQFPIEPQRKVLRAVDVTRIAKLDR